MLSSDITTTGHIYKAIEFQSDIQMTQHFKDEINTQNQCQIWIYTCCVQLNIILWVRVNLNFTEILKTDTLRLQQLWNNYYIFE